MKYKFEKAAQDNGFTGAITNDETWVITKEEGRGAISKNDPVKPPIVF